MSLLQYAKEVEPAIKFVFGRTLICTDSDTANKVTDKFRIRTVTLRIPSLPLLFPCPSPFIVFVLQRAICLSLLVH